MAPAVPHRPKNWLLIQFRDWHSFLGVWLSLLILVICVTGIYLNHKDLFHFKWFTTAKYVGEKSESHEKYEKKEKPKPTASAASLQTNTQLASLPISLETALTHAQEQWGDAPLEKIELKNEHGELLIKIKRLDEQELILNVATRQWSEKKPGPYDLGKIMKDLHTGKLGGTTGKLIVDATSAVIILLTLSGLYLWGVPKWRKRQSQLQRANLT